jgi:hypothetical protein
VIARSWGFKSPLAHQGLTTMVRGSYEILTFDDLLERGKLLLRVLRGCQQ